MSRTLTSAAGLAGMGLAVMSSGAAAGAQGFDASRVYLKAFGGAEFAQGDTAHSNSGLLDISYDFDYDTGYVLGAAAGYSVSDRVALELEYAYRRSDATVDVHYIYYGGGVPFEGNDTFDERVTVQSGMVNALYRFPGVGPEGRATPYLGAGVGVASVDVRGAGTADAAFAWQAIGGVSWAIDERWSLDGELRWFSTTADNFYEDENESIDMDFDAFDVVVGVSYRF